MLFHLAMFPLRVLIVVSCLICLALLAVVLAPLLCLFGVAWLDANAAPDALGC